MREVEEILRLFSAGLVPCFAYLCLGLRLVDRFGPAVEQGGGAERWAWAWLLGTGVASLAILLLRGVGLPLPLLAAGAVAAAFWPFRRFQSPAAAGPAPERSALVRRVETAAAAFAGLLFVASLGPETYWDGFEYHLPLIAAWTEGPIRAIPGLIDAEFRAGIDLLGVPAMTSGFPDAVASVSAGFAFALALLVRAEVTRRTSAEAGAMAGGFLLLSPLILELAPSSYVDLGVGAYGFGALLLADRWNRGGSARDLQAAALCLAFAANAKLNAAVLVPAVLVLVLTGGRPPSPRVLGQCAIWVAVLTAPWFVKTALTSGNPIYPLAAGWLGSGGADPRYFELRAFRGVANYPVDRNPLGFLQYLVSLSWGRNVHVSGLLGPLPAALAPLALTRPSRATCALLGVAGVLLILLFVALPAARFGTPLWPWLAVVAAIGGQRLAASGRIPRVVLVVVLAVVATHQLVLAASVLLPRARALRFPAAYEEASFPDQHNLRQMVAQAEAVVAIPMGAVAWMGQPVYNLLWERNGELFFREGTSPVEALATLEERDVRSVVIDVASPHPDDGRTGHPIVDAWLDRGLAALAPGVAPLAARDGKRWVLVRFVTRGRNKTQE